MAEEKLDGLRVTRMATEGFEQVELEKPRQALDRAGAATKIVSPAGARVKAWGSAFKRDLALGDARVDNFDAQLLPGGVINPDRLRIIPEAVAFVKAFFDAGKPVAAICHGPWMVLEAGAARGRRMASWPSLKTDLRNAGAQWVDEEVVVDGNLVTSRKPDDIPALDREMLALFARHAVTAG
jgi:protease I